MLIAKPNFPASIVPAGQGKTLHAFGEEITLLLTGEQTNHQMTLWQEVVPPGGGPPPHYHLCDDEWFVVQEGKVSFLLDGKWHEQSPGAAVYLPRRVVHTFHNFGDTKARLLVATAPSGFEVFFSRCAEEFAKPGGPDMDRIVSISAEHGIHYVNP